MEIYVSKVKKICFVFNAKLRKINDLWITVSTATYWLAPILSFIPQNHFLFPSLTPARAAVVHLSFRVGSTFPVCTVPSSPGSMNRSSRCNKVDAVRLYASYRIKLLLLKGQICVPGGGRVVYKTCVRKK